jgi:hypothetical protein
VTLEEASAELVGILTVLSFCLNLPIIDMVRLELCGRSLASLHDQLGHWCRILLVAFVCLWVYQADCFKLIVALDRFKGAPNKY